MSKDIRSFFLPKKAPKPKVEDDDDVIPESPDVQIKKKKESKRKRIIDDDSDEEIFKTKQTKTADKRADKSNRKTTKQNLKEVSASDIFNSAPIKRTDPLVKKEKKTETGIHSDEEFEKSLLEIDALDPEPVSLPPDTETINGKDKGNPKDTDSKIDSKDKLKSKDTIKLETNDKTTKAHSSKDKKPNHVETKKDRITDKIEKGPNKDQKRKFSEFVDDNADKDKANSNKKIKLEVTKTQNGNNHVKKESFEDDLETTVIEDSQETVPKKKHNRSLNESVLTDEERYERKRQSIDLYHKYLNRSGPKNLGAKQIPEGTPDCLKDCAFLLTGVLDSFEREEIVEAITKHGGCVKNGISKKVTHVLAGTDAGPAKMAKAEELGIKIINEDDFLRMIKEPSKNKTKDVKSEKTPNNKSHKDSKHKEEMRDREKRSEKSSNNTQESSKILKAAKSREKSRSPNKINLDRDKTPTIIKSETKILHGKDIDKKVESNKKVDHQTPLPLANASMWVEKHKPQTVKQIIGQHGDASNVKKLINWLTKWYVNRKAKLPKPSPWAKNDDGGYYKAVLLSGPPGVGKTTTVSLVCKELGFDAVEFNASDTRNRTLIKEQIGELLTTNSLSGFAKGDTGKQAVSKKHVLVMDEVDGMAGNEDRGGLQELIGLIKSTSVPIICMCNDRNSQKMRSLVNYCYDLKFSRPRVDQIKSAMLSICFKEGIKIPPDVLSQLIVSANQDVRQTLNLLSMWAVEPKLADADRLRKDAKGTKKDVKLGPWEAVRKVFSAEDHKTMSIHDRSDLFFYDYSLAPLFVQENYLSVEPHCPKNEVLMRVSAAADSISCGDLVDARIRRSQAWGLLPLQAMYSSVIPGHALSGHVSGQIQFPGWLGKNSRASKMNRLCQEIHAHTRLSTSGSKSSIYLDYCTHLRDAIVQPLIKERTDGIDQSLQVLESYHLLREDLDSLLELSLWPGQRNPMVLIDAKVKAAMTRTYNKKASALPYAPAAVKKGRPNAHEDDGYGLEEDDDDQPDNSDTDTDAMIKKKKEKPEKSSSNKDKPSTSKAKATSKGKSKKS